MCTWLTALAVLRYAPDYGDFGAIMVMFPECASLLPGYACYAIQECKHTHATSQSRCASRAMPCREASGVRSSGRWVLFPLTQPASAKNSLESRFRSLDGAQRNRGRSSAPGFHCISSGLRLLLARRQSWVSRRLTSPMSGRASGRSALAKVRLDGPVRRLSHGVRTIALRLSLERRGIAQG